MNRARPERSALRRLDVIGAALYLAAIGWTYASAGATSSAHRTAAVFVAAGMATLAGRIVGRVAGWVVPGAIAAVAAFMAVASPDDITSHLPLSGPFGYANAKGAFFMIAAVAALSAFARPGRPVALAVGIVAAVPFVAVLFESHTLTAAVLALAVPGVALAIHALSSPRIAVDICGVAVAIAVATTSFLGATYRPADRSAFIDRVVDRSLTERRIALWHESGSIMGDRPLRGVGAGRFAEVSPTARSDEDARWAHHAFLQQGAEAGVVGFGLLISLFVWGFVRLAVGARDIRQTLGAAALAAVGIHASLDYVFHFPAIPIALAALVGSATAWPRGRPRVRGRSPSSPEARADIIAEASPDGARHAGIESPKTR